MNLIEHVPLSTLTTLKVGGPARYLIDCQDAAQVREALAFARERSLPFAVLGEGSNILPSDAGFDGVALRIQISGIEATEDGADLLLNAGAGVRWDDLVREAAARGLWGIENLAGIPGTVGAAPVQNIGAYGAEVKHVIESVEVFDAKSDETRILPRAECAFGYRDSLFKHDPSLIVLSVTFRLARSGEPKLGYADLAKAAEEGVRLDTPEAIGAAVREIRSRKFPDLAACGTAGSFFKNPIISRSEFGLLAERYGAVPSFPMGEEVKVPLAFILDRVLHLRGFREGNVSLFGNQPLVLVADHGADAAEIDAFADSIARAVKEATGIGIEREVRNFPAT